MAGERGASAVLFDITEDRAAAEQVPGDMLVFQKGSGWKKVGFLVGGGSRSHNSPCGALFSAAAAAPGADLAGGADLGHRC